MKTLGWLRILAWLEGFSWIALLATMYLKYGMDMPEPNKVTGMAHGLFFVGYLVVLLVVKFEVPWNWRRTFWCGLASILPFGTFWAERKLFTAVPDYAPAPSED